VGPAGFGPATKRIQAQIQFGYHLSVLEDLWLTRQGRLLICRELTIWCSDKVDKLVNGLFPTGHEMEDLRLKCRFEIL